MRFLTVASTLGDSNHQSELLQVYEQLEWPVITAMDVADALGITQQAAYAKLDSAHENGEFERRKVGSRAVVWWPVDYDSEFL